MIDTKGAALPRADRIAIPQADVRIWGDHAVGVTVEPGPDGTGVTVRITNTGRKAIPAVPDWAASVPSEDEIQEVRTTVTVTAAAIEPSKAAPVVLLAVPLADALLPGKSITIDVPGIGAATARTTNWLSVDLRLPDDPAWLAAYLPVGILRSGTALGELTHPAPARPDGQAVTGTQPGSAAPHVATCEDANPDRGAHRQAVARAHRQAGPGRHAVALGGAGCHARAVTLGGAGCHARADARSQGQGHTRADASPRPASPSPGRSPSGVGRSGTAATGAAPRTAATWAAASPGPRTRARRRHSRSRARR